MVEFRGAVSAAAKGRSESALKAQSGLPRFRDNFRHLPAGAISFDAMGRPALNPKPGVYFVRVVSGKLSAVGCHKVIVTR